MNDRSPPHRFVTHLRVRAYEMDSWGHVNNAVYLHYLEHAAWEHSAYLGWGRDDYVTMNGLFVLRRMEIEYLRPAVGGDTLAITTWAHEMRGARAVRNYEIAQAETGIMIVQATGLWAWVDGSSGRPRPIPAAVIERFTRPVDPAAGEHER